MTLILSLVELAAFDEGGPLLELGPARRDSDRLAFQFLGGLDAGFREHDGGGRVAPVDRADHRELHALGDAGADDEPVGEPELAGLAGDQLGRAARSFSGPHVHVEAGLVIEALVLGDHESGIRALIDPVEPKAHVTLLRLCGCALEARDGHPCDRDRAKERAPAGKRLKHEMTSCAGGRPGWRSPTPASLADQQPCFSIQVPCQGCGWAAARRYGHFDPAAPPWPRQNAAGACVPTTQTCAAGSSAT